MKRSPIKRKTPLRARRKEPTVRREDKPRAELAPVQSLHRGTYAGGTRPREVIVLRPRKNGKATEMRHKAALVDLGCMVCRRLFPGITPGPVELHHLRGGGWGKGDYTTLIPLCVEHHRGATGVHGLGTKGFPAHYGFDQADLLADAKQLLEQQQ